ncbi:MAG TPA: ABC transporter ATP-binding protein [Gemmatimonadales bacterium]|jgi:lipopolysaccharide transport system ATP-binding protein
MAGQVHFDAVWKRFRRGLAHDSLRDLIPALARRLKTGAAAAEPELREGDFWAVRDVSFEVNPGEALGIIGGNGAGKSTTLKLLTKVLMPTRGVARITGRAGALIEVSAGFHPDLTGRENVFLQGAIMGMPMQLIRTRFDEIVEFSGVSAFIDTPVKRYSSGMNARLGFSIAAHLEPEVLIVDEVLSVGDAEFQTRAFDRLRMLVRSNIPVVIVSHQLDRIVELCTDCILLQSGQAAFHGAPHLAVQEYLRGTAGGGISLEEATTAGIGILGLTAPEPQPVTSGSSFTCSITGEVTAAEPPADVELGIAIVDAATNQRMYWTTFRSIGVHPVRRGRFTASVAIEANIPPGLYRIDTAVWHVRRQLIIGQGPNRIFQVVPGRPFSGTHQLNAAAIS